MNKNTKSLNLLNDQAIGEGNSFDNDGLGFDAYSEIIGQAILNSSTPFTVGIFGEWGTGKTSLMRMLEKYLLDKGKNDVITIWFNAWRFEKDEHPLIPLIAHIVQEAKKRNSFLKNLNDGGKTLLEALRAVAYGVSGKAKLTMPGFAEIEAAFVAKDMIDREEKLTSDPLLDRSLYYDAFNKLSNLKLGSTKRIVIIVDDLDRCFPDIALKLLESIKLIFSQPSFVFVIGASRTILEGYIEHRYQKIYGLQNFDGRSYFDKIIQLPFYIPPHKGRIKNFSERIIQRIKDDESKKEIESVFGIIEISCADNPRAIIRFVNNLLIDQAINKHLFKTDETDYRIGIGYFAITRSLQQNWKEFFEILINSTELCYLLSMFNNMNEIDKALFGKIIQSNKLHIIDKMVDDNDFQKILFSQTGIDWLKNENLRLSAIEFILTKRTENIVSDSIIEIEKSAWEYIYRKKEEEALSSTGVYIDFKEAERKYNELRISQASNPPLVGIETAAQQYLELQRKLKDNQTK